MAATAFGMTLAYYRFDGNNLPGATGMTVPQTGRGVTWA